MGQAKKSWEEDLEREFSADSNVYICSECFEDPGLKSFIQARNIGATCKYCGSSVNPTCGFDTLIEHIVASLRLEWGDPADEGLPWESREGGWQGNVLDTHDVIETTEMDVQDSDLQDAIVAAIHTDQWCERDPYSLRQDQTLFFGWQAFSRFVIGEARYVFLNATPSEYDEHQHDEMHPVAILDALSSMVSTLGLVVALQETTEIFRVRIIDKGTNLTSASELGSPPRQFATIPNRMSPAGISMFYGAFDLETSIAETYEPNQSSGKIAAYGVFHPARPLKVLDLSEKPNVPSLYDEHRNQTRSIIKFLLQFLQDFTKPISRDDRSHIEYVPTQIVTEYFRHIFRTEAGERLDGIIYPSSKNDGKLALVIFAENSECADQSTSLSGDEILILLNSGQADPNI